MSKPTNFSVKESLEVIWEIIYQWEDMRNEKHRPIHESISVDDVKLSMAWITEDLETDSFDYKEIDRAYEEYKRFSIDDLEDLEDVAFNGNDRLIRLFATTDALRYTGRL